MHISKTTTDPSPPIFNEMTLVDTSVWVEYFRQGHEDLRTLLQEGEVMTHAMIPKHLETLRSLDQLPRVLQSSDDAVRDAIEEHRLYGHGIGWVDAHLAVAAAQADVPLMTLDTRLSNLARKLRVLS